MAETRPTVEVAAWWLPQGQGERVADGQACGACPSTDVGWGGPGLSCVDCRIVLSAFAVDARADADRAGLAVPACSIAPVGGKATPGWSGAGGAPRSPVEVTDWWSWS